MMNPCSFFLFLFFFCSATLAPAQDPDIEDDERSVLEGVYRSSDEAGETPTGRGARGRRSGNKRVSVPHGAVRIGCICMDDSHSRAQSIGACSGHGGVRYWLYRNTEGDTLRVITGRHEIHPQALDSAERSAIVQPRSARAKNLPVALPVSPAAYAPPVIIVQAPEPPAPIGWGEIAMIAMAGATFFFTLRLLLQWAEANHPLIRHALRHLLRHRQRPPARKNRKIARKARL